MIRRSFLSCFAALLPIKRTAAATTNSTCAPIKRFAKGERLSARRLNELVDQMNQSAREQQQVLARLDQTSAMTRDLLARMG